MKKYVIAGGVGVAVLAGVLIALAYMTQPPQARQDSSTITPVPQGATTGAGQDNPGPTDGGGTPDTTSKPVPDTTPTAAISASPNPATVADKIDVEGSGFNGTQTITLALGGVAVETEPSQLKTDDAGNFSAKFSISGGQTGSLEVSATDESGNKASTTLSVR